MYILSIIILLGDDNMNKETINENCQNKQCPVETTLNILSGKWKGIILYRLLGGKIRFNELKSMMPNINSQGINYPITSIRTRWCYKTYCIS
jgi:hypothetical protein